MNLQNIVTYFHDAWAVVGPLVGVVIGGYLATWNQKQQWARDNKRMEFRELLTGIGDATSKLILYYGGNPVVLTSGEQASAFETMRATLGIIYDRLFVADAVKELNIQHRWQDAVTALQEKHDVAFFGNSMDKIMEDIRQKALKEFA